MIKLCANRDDDEDANTDIEEKALLKKQPIVMKPGFPEHASPAMTAGELAALGPPPDDPEGEDEYGWNAASRGLVRSQTDAGTRKTKAGIFDRLKGDYHKEKSKERRLERSQSRAAGGDE